MHALGRYASGNGFENACWVSFLIESVTKRAIFSALQKGKCSVLSYKEVSFNEDNGV